MSRYFLANQKHSAWPMSCDSQTNDSNEPVLFIESETVSPTSTIDKY